MKPVEVSSLTALRGPEVRFSNVKAERAGATIDVTFDVSWTDSWGQGQLAQRDPRFSERNWDAAWVFFKYRLADPAGQPVVFDVPLLHPDVAAELVRRFDEGSDDVLSALLRLAPEGTGAARGTADDPWSAAQLVVRTVKPGSLWQLEVRDSPKAPSYSIQVELIPGAGPPETASGGGTPRHDALRLSMLRVWKHARILSVQDEGPTARVDSSGDGAGVFVRQAPPGERGPVALTGIRLRCALMDLPMDLQPDQPVELWPFGIEMVYVPEEPFWLGDPEPHGRSRPRNCFYNALALADARNQAYYVASEKAIQVGPAHGKRPPRDCDQLLWYDNDDDARGAGDHQRIHGLDTLAPHERWKEARIPAEFPKGFQATYVMKRQVTQGQYAAFINALDGGSHPDRFGQLVRFSWDGAGTHRGTIDVPGPDPFARVAARPYRACNHLCWADAMAFAAWAGLRPMTELEYEKACRGPKDPVPGEFAWGIGPVPGQNLIANEILGHEDGTEIVVGNVNINNKNRDFKGGDGGGGPVRDDAFDLRRPAPEPSTFWLNAKGPKPTPRPDPRGERLSRGLSYYGIAALSGNLWELCVTIGTREGRSYRGDHGHGEVTEHGEAPWKQLGWPNQTALSVSWRGGSWFTDFTRGQVAARPYGSGAPGFFHRSNDAGFRAVRTAPVPADADPTPSMRRREHGYADQVTLLRSHNPVKLLTWLPPSRARAAVRTDASVSAALFDMSEAEYNATREGIDVQVGRAARELLRDPDFRRLAETVPFVDRARIFALGDDCLDDRQSWAEILRYVLEECHDGKRLAVINTGVRDDTTTQMIPRLAALVRSTSGFKVPDMIICQAGVSDARRFLDLARPQVSPAETAANLAALRALADPMLRKVRHERNPPGPSWLWLSPPGVVDDPGDTAAPLPTWHLESQDLVAVTAATRDVAARHPDDLFVDLLAEGIKIDQHAHVPAVYDDDVDGGHPPPAYVGLLHMDEHKKIVRRIVQALHDWADKKKG
jgi:formylglycine-generating enzyme required for sulfatase activity